MNVSISTILVRPALRASTLTALCLGLGVMAPLRAERLPVDLRDTHKLPSDPGQTGVKPHTRTPEQVTMEELEKTLSARITPPSYSAAPERDALVTGTELLSDGGFEGGYYGGNQTLATSGATGPWTWSNSPSTLNPIWQNYGSSVARTGNFMVYFYPLGPQTQRLYQTVSIPAGVTATLSFWAKIGTLETTHTMVYDTMRVSITDTSGVVLGSITYSNLDDNAGFAWVKHSLDVSAYAGRTVRLQFDTYEDSTGATIFMLDDVSILASAASASCQEDALTMCLVNGRYKVTSHWKNQYAGGTVATLSKAKLTDVEGAFWIADASTHEYLIRFNTATNNGRVWVAIPTFTDVEFWIAVTDTVNGQYKEYHSTPGNKTLIYDPSFFIFP